MKAIPEMPHLPTNVTQEIQINIGVMAISNSKCEKLLGIQIEPHIRSLCKKTSQKLSAFARLV